MVEVPVAADPASPWMTRLERAHALALAAARVIEEEVEPSAYLGPAARRIEGGLAAIYDAFDGRADRLSAIGAAHARLFEAAIFLARAGFGAALASLEAACAELISAEERFPRVPMAGRAPVDLVAGADLPRLHTIERASIVPSFRSPPVPEIEAARALPVLPEPKTFAELRAAAEAAREAARARGLPKPKLAAKPAPPPPPEPPRGFAIVPPPALAEADFVRRWARECIDEVGMLGVQRLPMPGEPFRVSLPLERRLVAAIDALAALGPTAIAHVEPYALDAPAADTMRIFAVTMIGGSLEGRDALACAERVLHRFGAGDPAVAEPFVSAMKLAENPFVPSVLRSLWASGDAAAKRIAAEVLAHRGLAAEAELAAFAEDGDPELLAIAVRALGIGRHRELHRVLPVALAHAEPSVQLAGLEAMALAAHPEAASAARAAASGALGDDALLALAIVADEADARWLTDRMIAAPSEASIAAAGWAGHIDAVPALIRALDEGEDAEKLAAGEALRRLLGAALVETVEVPPDELEDDGLADPDPDARPTRRPLADLVSDPRDKPPPGKPEKLEVASTDPEQWRAYWAEHGSKLDRRLRTRRGQAYSPSISLYELDQLGLDPEERRLLHRELAARTGKITAFDPHDFVVKQEQRLKAWEALVRATLSSPGAWTRARGV